MNNAGVLKRGVGVFETFGIGPARETLNTNYYGSRSVTEALLPSLRPSASGARIVNVSSGLGHLHILGAQLQVGSQALRYTTGAPGLLLLAVRRRLVGKGSGALAHPGPSCTSELQAGGAPHVHAVIKGTPCLQYWWTCMARGGGWSAEGVGHLLRPYCSLSL